MNKRSSLFTAVLFCALSVVAVGGIATLGDSWQLLVLALAGAVAAVAPMLLRTYHRFTPFFVGALTLSLLAVTGAVLSYLAGEAVGTMVLALVAILPLLLAVHLMTEMLYQARLQGGLFSIDTDVQQKAEADFNYYNNDMQTARTPAALLWRYFLRRDAAKVAPAAPVEKSED